MGTIRPTLLPEAKTDGDDQTYSIRGDDRWGRSDLLYQWSGQVGTIRPTLSEVRTGGDDQAYSVTRGQDRWGRSGLLYQQRPGQVGEYHVGPLAPTNFTTLGDAWVYVLDPYYRTFMKKFHLERWKEQSTHSPPPPPPSHPYSSHYPAPTPIRAAAKKINKNK